MIPVPVYQGSNFYLANTRLTLGVWSWMFVVDSSQEELYIAGDSNTGKIKYSSLAAYSHKFLALWGKLNGDLVNQGPPLIKQNSRAILEGYDHVQQKDKDNGREHSV